ncbi:coatomer subunit beta-1 [Anopheles sinensis]|uniref:Coatomer subunit beta-1 n=1 Tax=Anopheles sinensis TaxID=74873 RepID=A0A084VXG1_ANOSI|nr:coatomer subunit beta-1 [Anopheles sinensis]
MAVAAFWRTNFQGRSAASSRHQPWFDARCTASMVSSEKPVVLCDGGVGGESAPSSAAIKPPSSDHPEADQ